MEPVTLLEGRRGTWTAPPFQRDHVEDREAGGGAALVDRVLGQQLDRAPCPGLGGSRRALRFGHHGERPKHRVAVAEERVRVGDAVVGASGDAEDGLASAKVTEGEPETVELRGRRRPRRARRHRSRRLRTAAARSARARRPGARPGEARRTRTRRLGQRPGRRPAPRRRRGPGTPPACTPASTSARPRSTVRGPGRRHRELRRSPTRRVDRGSGWRQPRWRCARRARRAHGRPARREGRRRWDTRGEANRKPARFRRSPVSHPCGFPRYGRGGEEVGGTSLRRCRAGWGSIQVADHTRNAQRDKRFPVAARAQRVADCRP